MSSPSAQACTLGDGTTMGSIPDVDVRRATSMPDHDGTRSGSKGPLGHDVDDAWTQWSCIINTLHIESCLRSSLYMSRRLSLGVHARTLRHNHCLDYIGEDFVRSSSDPRGSTKCKRRQPHDIFVPSRVTGLTQLLSVSELLRPLLCSQQFSALSWHWTCH